MNLFYDIEQWIQTNVNLQNVEELLQGYQGLGLFLGVLLPALEAIFPPLPLVAFVLANAAAYGFFIGFLLSWSGTVIGSFVVFMFIRWLAHKRLRTFLERSKKIERMLEWVDRRGFGPVFFVSSIPFTPSSLINVVAGLSEMNPYSFFLSIMLGKAVMIGVVTFIGADWRDMVANPLQLIPVAIGMVIFWFIGKWLERRMYNKHPDLDKKERELSNK
ncbi:putative membrane protein YdjX (TVP38/TMEM64 family) [Pullulanibacillus pueri]|uniref:TVP38/TMEM64 family membrane protein n=1 Tax=Pullulanibacillus pueri TaxID=1437324 RepID=A0A8J2ZY33_9BACL|nr:TVP38/TMEM64 family protein [Pullulanibacillus pueri]MBM7680530.1 putative membrane protein YdjX (TVP38/TMEM64 family) [Pullulanibacillus pueri]GGH86130.1 TVP38/TMEM64 family protein [Pullulanibacillus pueri]